MAITKTKGDLGEAMTIAEAMKRGYKVAIPVGEDWRYDLIVLRNGSLDRVQCKYTESNGEVISVKCRSTNGHSTIKYSSQDIDWLVVYDKTTDRCYFIPSVFLGNGRAEITLRVVPGKNGQTKGVNLASDFLVW